MHRTHALAAVLLTMGAAALVFFSFTIEGTAEPQTPIENFSIGIVPSAQFLAAATGDDRARSVPDRPDRKIDSTRDRVTPGRETERIERVPVPTPPAVPSATRFPRDGVEQVDSGMVPVAIRIPKIGVAADVVEVGTTDGGAMDTPDQYDDVGWWSGGSRPGESGRAVLAGHLDSARGGAVFFRLDELEPGDEIIVGDGLSELRYTVRGLAIYQVDAAPVADIFGPSLERELILITCGGEFDRRSSSYLHRLVVFAVLDGGGSESEELSIGRSLSS